MLASAVVAPAQLAPAAYGAPSSASEVELEIKKAARDATLAEVGRIERRVRAQTDAYVETVQRIEAVREEASQVASDAEQLELSLVETQDALALRVQQLYRTGPTDTLELFLTMESIADFILRTDTMRMLADRDARLADEVSRLRDSALRTQVRLANRMARIGRLQAEAEAARVDLERELADRRRLLASLGADIATLEAERARSFSGGVPGRAFDREYVMSDAVFGDAAAMSVEDVQTFLESQPGTLDTYRAKDHLGVPRTVAEMVVEAAAAHRVNPKVILVTLQKEQSLLSRTDPSQRAYDWAMGCGKADSRTFYQYQGFGNQIWWGAQKLRKNAGLWRPGITKRVDGTVIHPRNAATHAQYMYTPHFHGVTSFWMLYWRYFGDPL